MTKMKAKFTVAAVTPAHGGSEILHGYPVCGKLDEDGNSEDNTFARYSPSGKFELHINNPALVGKIEPGDTLMFDIEVIKRA